jgi:DNA-binding protein H-NS
MSTVADLQAQIAELQAKVEEAKKAEQKGAIAKCRELIAQYGLTEKQLFGGRGASNKAAAPAAYRDPATGKTWSGKGRTPFWLVDKNREDFRI